ncbi:MAG: SDR family oxidoreductase [Anaerolineales bacterium]|nr:SDR family oxidoreductase [Anaerolineales bacterium]
MIKVLFIGGTGIISSACAPLAIERGMQVYLLNRGQSFRPTPDGAHVLHADIRDPESVREAIKGHNFDVVVDWIAFTPEHIQTDIDLFKGRTKQYIFISSASAYQKPISLLPITESTPLHNPYWEYSRNKIACEELLTETYRNEGFPITIVRPSHTYDKTLLPNMGGYTDIARLRQGKAVIIHGDGSSLWALTHHKDFAKAFVGLMGNPHALGETYQITSDELLSWNQIYQMLADAAGVELNAIHIPSDFIAAHAPEYGPGLVGDKAHSVIFDNTKIKRAVPGFVATIPFVQGAREIMAWYDANPERQMVDEKVDQTMDRIIAAYQKALP